MTSEWVDGVLHWHEHITKSIGDEESGRTKVLRLSFFIFGI